LKRDDLKSLATKVHRDPGDALVGERVIIQARKFGDIHVTHGTSTHKIQEVCAERNVMCVLDRAFRTKEPELRIKDNKPK